MKRTMAVFIYALFLSAAWCACRHTNIRPQGFKDSDQRTQSIEPSFSVQQVEKSLSNFHQPVPKSVSKTQDLVEVDMFQRGFSLSVDKAEYDRGMAQMEEKVQSIIARDIADGINGKVRDRERELKALSGNLPPGTKEEEAIKILGPPDKVFANYDTNRLNGMALVQLGYTPRAPGGTVFAYWPREQAPFDGRNGQGYHVLFLRFDPHGRLLTSQWEPPEIEMIGTLNMRHKLEVWLRGTPQK